MQIYGAGILALLQLDRNEVISARKGHFSSTTHSIDDLTSSMRFKNTSENLCHTAYARLLEAPSAKASVSDTMVTEELVNQDWCLMLAAC